MLGIWTSIWDKVYRHRFFRTWYESLTNKKTGPSATKLTAFFFSVLCFAPAYWTLTIWSFINDNWQWWVTLSEILLLTIAALLGVNILNKWVERKNEKSQDNLNNTPEH
jgi:thiol:disulfide interchange protein